MIGAESRNRTGTLFPARDFESRASTFQCAAYPVQLSRSVKRQQIRP